MPTQIVEMAELNLQNIVYYLKYGFVLLLRRCFRHLGRAIGRHPYKFIILTLLVSSISAGLYRAKLYSKIKAGYTPVRAPSHLEDKIFQQFYSKSSSEPHESLALITSKDGRSLLDDDILKEITNFSDYVSNKFSVMGADGRNYTLANLCEALCDINLPVQLVAETIEDPMPYSTYVHYPISAYLGMDVDLSFNFFGVRNRANYSEFDTNRIEHVSLIMLYLLPQAHNDSFTQIVIDWELALFDWIYHDFYNPLINVAVTGDRMIVRELNRGGLSVGRYLGVGFVIMCTFVFTAFSSGALYYGQFNKGTILFTVAAICSPFLACAATFGMICALDFSLYPVLMIAPYLILAIGVDDAFLMVHAWHRLTELHGSSKNVPERLGMVLEDVGPSVTITSITNTLAFGIGISTSTPAIQVFCLVTAIAMMVSFVFTLTFFGAFLAIAGGMEIVVIEKKPLQQRLRAKFGSLVNRVMHVYCKLLTDRFVSAFIILMTVAMWVAAIIGTMKIKTDVSMRKVLPHDTPLFEADDLIGIIWKSYYPVMVFVNNPGHINNKAEHATFQKMVQEYETAKYAIGPTSTRSWLRDYEEYEDDGFLDFLGLGDGKADDEVFSLSNLEQFLEEKPYWKPFIHYNKSGDSIPTVTEFVFSTGFQNATNWDTRVEIVVRWRKIAQKYPQFNVTVYGQNNYIVDAIINLRDVTKKTIGITLLCMALVCTLFIPSLCGVLCASWAIASTSLAVFGSLSWWGLDLDPVTMAAILMSIGFSVDFTAHTSYHYQKAIIDGQGDKITKRDRLLITMDSVCWPMLQAGACTMLCVVPLAFHGDYAPDVFFKTIYLLVTWGLIHGLFILPTILSALPDCFVTATTTKKKAKTRSVDCKNGDVANGAEMEPLQQTITTA